MPWTASRPTARCPPSRSMAIGGKRVILCCARKSSRAEPTLPLEAEEEEHRLAASVNANETVRRTVPSVTINQSDDRTALLFGPSCTLSVIERPNLHRHD